jgi:flagellar M-ring protein FliF
LQQLLKQLLEIWMKLTRIQRVVIIGALVFLMAAILILARWASTPEFVPIATGQTMEQTAMISTQLDEMGIKYQISQDETMVSVPEKDKHRARMALVTEGILGGKNAGWEIFDESKLGTTDFERRVNYLRALQGELEMTIAQLNGVKAARVHITIPEEKFFEKDQKPSKASITLMLQPGKTLEEEQVMGIVNLIVGAVDGLDARNVVIIDTNGNILSTDTLGTDGFSIGSGTVKTLEIQDAFNKKMAAELQSMLEQVLGIGKVVVRVSAALDFDQKTIERDIYQPVVDGKGIARSVQNLQEFFEGTNSGAGVPGTTSNPPTYPIDATGQDVVSERYQSSTTYEITNIKEYQEVAPGTVKRMTVAVVVDGELTQAQITAIEQTVSAAIGLDITRGDAVIVQGIPYDKTFQDAAAEDFLPVEDVQPWYIYLIQILAILFAFFLIYRALFRRRRRTDDEDDGLDIVVGDELAIGADGMTYKLGSLSPDEMERQKMIEQIQSMARKQPDDVANLIRTWLSEDDE